LIRRRGADFFPGTTGDYTWSQGPEPTFSLPPSYKFRAKSCANAGLLNWFDGVCKVKSGFSQIMKISGVQALSEKAESKEERT